MENENAKESGAGTAAQNRKKSNSAARKIATMGMMAAISVILVYFIHFPIFPAAAFLEYDPADITIFICTFMYGPVSGFLMTVVVAAIQAATVSAASGLYGFIMHVISTGAFAIVAGNIYKHHKTRKAAVIALVCGCVTTTVVMAGANMVVTPYFMGVPASAVAGMLLPIIIPFNLIKVCINSVITFILYKSIASKIPHGTLTRKA